MKENKPVICNNVCGLDKRCVDKVEDGVIVGRMMNEHGRDGKFVDVQVRKCPLLEHRAPVRTKNGNYVNFG